MMTGPLLRAALLGLVASCLPACSQNTGSVVGRVMCADSRTPCRFASVTIETAPPRKDLAVPAGTKLPSHGYAAATELDGTFAMENVLPGEYYITAIQTGYLAPYDLAMSEVNENASLKAQAVDIALERVVVQTGQTTTANILLTRGASLSGTVRYEDGGQANTVAISLFRKDGTGKWQPYTNTAGTGDMAKLGFGPKTDDRGRFYAPGLPPGTYALQASLPSTAMLLSGITGRQSMNAKMLMGGALQVFYGNSYRLKDAKAIEVHNGEDRVGLDIDIPVSGMYTLRGLVTDGAEGPNSVNGRVQLLDAEDKSEIRNALIFEGGVFVFENVRPGSYVVRVEANGYGQRGPIQYQPLTAPLLIEGDLANLSYRLVRAKP